MMRQGAGLTTLQVLFDNLDMSQKLLGDLRIDLIQANWTPGKVQRVIAQEPSPQFYNRAFGKYKAVVEEGLNTSTQRQMEFAQLLNLRELGIPVPAEILVKSSTLQNKEELINALGQQEQQQAQMQQAQQEAQIEVLKAQIEDLKARAMANEGLGAERASRIQENRALAIERLAEAQKDRDLGNLDKIRAAKELTSIDLDQLERALNILKMMQGKEEEDQGVKPAKKTPKA